MDDVDVKTKIESRCGIVCSECEFLKKKICTNWCTKIDKPFHGECPVKKCCENKNLEFCGQCDEFPCELLNSFAYDKEHGDEGLRIKNCRDWCRSCKNSDQSK